MTEVTTGLTTLLGRMYTWFAFVPKITFLNLLEILLLSVLIYKILVWVQNTKALILLRGGIIIIVFYLAASIAHFTTITWIISHMSQLALIALIIIFQPELRRALEQLGSRNLITGLFGFDAEGHTDEYTDSTVNEIVRAAYEMGKVKTGALIVIERDIPLTEIERTGIAVDGLVTSQLLINIFEHNTPLHDGAVLVRGNRVAAATCYLPLSDNLSISKDLGTRHRAALGISESSDSMTVVVSEETGRVSLAQNGQLRRIQDPEVLRTELHIESTEQANTGRFRFWKGIRKHEDKAE